MSGRHHIHPSFIPIFLLNNLLYDFARLMVASENPASRAVERTNFDSMGPSANNSVKNFAALETKLSP
jgi:hypothetical protein